MKKFFGEFKKFALRGNVMDLAVGVIIGGAFQSVVKSLTDDIISPVIGLFAKTDFNGLFFQILGVNVKYGSFITTLINFLIMAFLVFLLVKGMNKIASFGEREKEPATPTVKNCPHCFSEIAVQATRCPYCTTELECQVCEPDAKQTN